MRITMYLLVRSYHAFQFLLEGGKRKNEGEGGGGGRKAHNQRSREKNVIIDIDKIVMILITTALYSK